MTAIRTDTRMESLLASLSCTEAWCTPRALLCSDINLKVGNILCLATICFLMCASTSSTCHERERYTRVWRKHDRARDLSKLRGVTPQCRQQNKMIKSKSKLIFNFRVQTDLTCQYPIAYSTPIHPKYWCTRGLSEIPFACSQAHYLQQQIPIWARQLPSLSLCIH